MRPEKTSLKPKTACSTVDLPAPLGPIRHSDCLRPTLRLKFGSTCRRP